MATKKISFGMNADDFTIEKMVESVESVESVKSDRLDFALAALKSLDWNQIGMGTDQAAKLCWEMADAMERNK